MMENMINFFEKIDVDLIDLKNSHKRQSENQDCDESKNIQLNDPQENAYLPTQLNNSQKSCTLDIVLFDGSQENHTEQSNTFSSVQTIQNIEVNSQPSICHTEKNKEEEPNKIDSKKSRDDEKENSKKRPNKSKRNESEKSDEDNQRKKAKRSRNNDNDENESKKKRRKRRIKQK